MYVKLKGETGVNSLPGANTEPTMIDDQPNAMELFCTFSSMKVRYINAFIVEINSKKTLTDVLYDEQKNIVLRCLWLVPIPGGTKSA